MNARTMPRFLNLLLAPGAAAGAAITGWMSRLSARIDAQELPHHHRMGAWEAVAGTLAREVLDAARRNNANHR